MFIFIVFAEISSKGECFNLAEVNNIAKPRLGKQTSTATVAMQ